MEGANYQTESTCRLDIVRVCRVNVDYETTFRRIRFVCCSGWLCGFYQTDSILFDTIYQKGREFPEVHAIVPLSFSVSLLVLEFFKAAEY